MATETYDIAIYVTDKCWEFGDKWYGNGYKAAEVAKTYIEGAFSHIDGKDVTITIPFQTPNPPKEAAGADMCDDICSNDGESGCWNTLWGWWTEWLNNSPCIDPEYYAKDCNFLISKGDGGGRAAVDAAVASVGSDLAALDKTYEDFGYDDDLHAAADTVLEELGHCLITNMSDADSDGSGHDSGVVMYDSANASYAITPMGLNNDTNNCENNPYPKSYTDTDSDSGPDGWAFQYSQCSIDHFQSPQ